MKKTEADATNQKMASQLANMLFITPGVHGPQNHSLPTTHTSLEPSPHPDPRRVFGDAGVVGLLETRKLVKGLPTSTLGRIKERHTSLTDSERNAVGGAQGNRNLYETLVGTDGRVSWHRAYDDAKATAAWLSSADVVHAIPACISAHSALVDMEQVISMVEVESAKKASKS